MLNKYTAALLATVVVGILFLLSYQVLTGACPGPVAVAIVAVLFFGAMLVLFEKILRKPAHHQG